MGFEEKREHPRMKNEGIVKHAYLVTEESNGLLECEVLDVSQVGMRAKIAEPGNFRYNIEENLSIPVRVIFNNDRELNLSSKICWFSDSTDFLEFGLYFKGSIW